jgi:hypothetical protein
MYEKKIKQIEEEMLPIGFVDDGQQEELVLEANDLWSTSKEKEIPPGYPMSRI